MSTTAAEEHHGRFRMLMLLVLVTLPWLSSFCGTYVFDDSREITESTRIKSFTPLRRHLRTQRPVQSLSLALNYKISGFDPWSYHLVNLLIHLGSVAALFALARGLTGSTSFAFVLALLWGVHPLQTESVTYIVQRAESMMGMFYLVALWAVMRACRSVRPLRWFSLAAFCGALGMLTKIVIGSLPFAALCMDRLFFARSFKEVLKKRWRGHAMILAIWLVPLLTGLLKKLLIGTGDGRGGMASAGLTLTHISSWDYLLSQPQVIAHYVRLVLWPVNLCLDYLWPGARSLGEAALPGLVILGTLGWAFLALRNGRRLAILPLFFFFVLAPTSSIFPVFDMAVEHRMYLPSIAIVAAVVLMFRRLRERFGLRPGVDVAAAGLAFVLLGWGTWQRNLVYADEATMWKKVLEVAPHNGRAHYQLAALAYRRGDYEEARRRCEKAMELLPRYGLNHLLMAQLENRAKRWDSSLAAAKRAVDLLPRLANAWNVYGSALFQKGRFEEAVEAHKRAAFLNPHHPVAYHRRAQAFLKLGNMMEAERAVNRAFAEGDVSAEAWSVKGVIARWRGDVDEALKSFKEALARDQENPQIWINYSLALESAWRFDEALQAAQRALQVDPESSRAQLQIGLMQDSLGQYREAEASFQHVLSMKEGPRGGMHAAARKLLGKVRRKLAALQHYEMAVSGGSGTLEAGTLVLLAEVAVARNEFDLAVRLYRDAFSRDPALAADLNAAHRYKASWAAARSGDFSQAALWLMADLKLREAQAASGSRGARRAQGAARAWLMERAFAPMRRENAPAPWPELWQRCRRLARPPGA